MVNKIPKNNKEKSNNFLSNLGLQFYLPESRGVNWDVATAIALDSSKNILLKKRDEIQETYGQALELIEPYVRKITGLEPTEGTDIIVLDRDEWIINTSESISALFDDITSTFWSVLEKQKSGPMTKKATSVIATTEVGLLLGFLAQKVLGQYDIGFHSKKNNDYLFIIEQNIAQREKMLGLEGAPLRLWIIAHEVTHRMQFKHFPWFKDYYLSLIEEAKTIVTNKASGQSQGVSSFSLLLNKKNWQLLSKIQSFMSFIEGYADFVMFSVGKSLPQFNRLKPVFNREQQNRPVLKKILEKIIGLDLKTSQYRQGLTFVSQLDELKGLNFLNKRIDEPTKIPTMKELSSPQEWLARVG